MVQRPPITPNHFFSDHAAREAGFTEQFWYQAYQLFLDEENRDPNPSLDKFFIARTIRAPFRQDFVDVLVRMQPEPGEYSSLRFTVFPAGNEPEVRQVSRWYSSNETRPVLGEGVLLDANFPW